MGKRTFACALAIAAGWVVSGTASPADSADGAQWTSVGRTADEQRFSPLTQINRDNVTRLGLAWFADFDTNRGQEATPLAIDGVLYVSTAWSKVKAYDARTGRLLWATIPRFRGSSPVAAAVMS